MELTINKLFDSQIRKELLIQNEEITTKQTIEVYREALAFSNLILEHQIHTRNVRIYDKDHVHQIYTSHPQENIPHLVMLHGFGGTALTYIRTFQHLKKYYQVHALDTFGVGLSSLGNYSQKFTHEEAKHYFVDAVEQWRKAVGIKKFTLVGHSFGGYIASLYCEKFPDHVRRLVLLSPAGTTLKSKEQLDAEIQKRKSTSFSSKVFMCLAEKIYNINIRPSKIMSSYILGNTFLQRITSGRLKLQDSEKQAWKKYLKAISGKDKSSETGFYKLFQWPVNPRKSIEEIISSNNFRFPVEFYFGSIDWMDRKGALRLCQNTSNVICQTIKQAGHQVIFDNPIEVVAKILRQDRIDKVQQKIEPNLNKQQSFKYFKKQNYCEEKQL